MIQNRDQDLRTALAQTCARAISDANITNCRADEALPVVDAMLAALRASPPRPDLISAAKAMAHKLVVEFGFLDHQHELKQLREAIARAEAAPPRPVDAEGVDPVRLLKEALFACLKANTGDKTYGGVLAAEGKFAFVRFTIEDAPAHSPDKAATREGVDRSIPALRLRQDPTKADAGLIEDYEAAALAPKPAGTEAGRGVETDALVDRFAVALKAKLRFSEAKHGWRDGWMRPDWQSDCQRDLAGHVAKGDPVDVAAYAAFCWHHGWSTAATPTPPVSPTPDSTGPAGAGVEVARAAFDKWFAATGLETSHRGLTACAWHEAWAAARAALTPSAPIAAPVRDERSHWLQVAQAAIAKAALAEDEPYRRAVLQTIEHEIWTHLKAAGLRVDPSVLASLPTPASDVPGDAQTQEGGR